MNDSVRFQERHYLGRQPTFIRQERCTCGLWSDVPLLFLRPLTYTCPFSSNFKWFQLTRSSTSKSRRWFETSLKNRHAILGSISTYLFSLSISVSGITFQSAHTTTGFISVHISTGKSLKKSKMIMTTSATWFKMSRASFFRDFISDALPFDRCLRAVTSIKTK